jgi:hypothetical protein
MSEENVETVRRAVEAFNEVLELAGEFDAAWEELALVL